MPLSWCVCVCVRSERLPSTQVRHLPKLPLHGESSVGLQVCITTTAVFAASDNALICANAVIPKSVHPNRIRENAQLKPLSDEDFKRVSAITTRMRGVDPRPKEWKQPSLPVWDETDPV